MAVRGYEGETVDVFQQKEKKKNKKRKKEKKENDFQEALRDLSPIVGRLPRAPRSLADAWLAGP